MKTKRKLPQLTKIIDRELEAGYSGINCISDLIKFMSDNEIPTNAKLELISENEYDYLNADIVGSTPLIRFSWKQEIANTNYDKQMIKYKIGGDK